MDMEDPTTVRLTPSWGGGGLGGGMNSSYARPPFQAPMKVVILAGDFHSSLVEEIYDELAILKKRPENFGTLPQNTHGSRYGLLRFSEGREGKARVAAGLIELGKATAVQHLVGMTQHLERLFPAEENVFMVASDLDLELYREHAESRGVLPAENIIGNGCKSPHEAVNPLRDLQLAIKHFGITDPVLCMTTDLVFLPDYNFKRIVEHAVIRSKDTCSYVRPCEQTHVIERDNGCTLPMVRVEGSKVTEIVDRPGACKATTELMPMFILRKASLPLVEEFVASSASGCIPSFLKFLSGKVELHGMDLEFGAFRTRSLQQLKFAQGVFDIYRETTKMYKEKLTERHLQDSVQLKWGEGFRQDKGANKAVNWMPAEIEKAVKSYMLTYLRSLKGPHVDGSVTYVVPEIIETYVRPTYTTPPTFYNTQYTIMTDKATHREEWRQRGAYQRSI
mmetsp:Transcript_30169/g.50757  ORF Transcript_30169/g.50757 Transcript_30169/m.50757 type:complete len:449 (+) Transcript_30169:116-1462(+)